MLEPLEDRIAPASLSFVDTDGDKVTLTAGRVSVEQLTEAVQFGADGSVEELDLSDPVFLNAAVTLSSAKVKGGTGDGLVDVGLLNFAGNTLKSISIDGDVGQVTGLSVGKLTLGSLGVAGGSEISAIAKVTTLAVKGDVADTQLDLANAGTVSISGSLLGGVDDHSGKITVANAIKTFKMTGDITGGEGDYSGTLVFSNGGSSITVGGIQGGTGDFSGLLGLAGAFKTVTTAGDVAGGSGVGSGMIAQGGKSLYLNTAGGNDIATPYDQAPLSGRYDLAVRLPIGDVVFANEESYFSDTERGYEKPTERWYVPVLVADGTSLDHSLAIPGEMVAELESAPGHHWELAALQYDMAAINAPFLTKELVTLPSHVVVRPDIPSAYFFGDRVYVAVETSVQVKPEYADEGDIWQYRTAGGIFFGFSDSQTYWSSGYVLKYDSLSADFDRIAEMIIEPTAIFQTMLSWGMTKDDLLAFIESNKVTDKSTEGYFSPEKVVSTVKAFGKVASTIGTLTIKGSLLGGEAERAGFIDAGTIKNMRISGSVEGGGYQSTGGVTADVVDTLRIGDGFHVTAPPANPTQTLTAAFVSIGDLGKAYVTKNTVWNEAASGSGKYLAGSGSVTSTDSAWLSIAGNKYAIGYQPYSGGSGSSSSGVSMGSASNSYAGFNLTLRPGPGSS